MRDIIWFILIGLAAGWIAGQIQKGRGFGLLGNLIVGSIGAILGGFLFNLVGLYTVGVIGNLIAAVVGAIIVLWLINKIK